MTSPPGIFFSATPSARPRGPVGRSLAQKQMVEIARALTVATKVVVMDEPTSMLSSRKRRAVSHHPRFSRQGMAFVYISHRMKSSLESPIASRFFATDAASSQVTLLPSVPMRWFDTW